MYFSKYSNRILYTLIRKKRAKVIIRKFYKMIKYFSLYFTSFIYALKYSRIFYNTFLFKKISKYIFLDLAFSHTRSNRKLLRFSNLKKYAFFPFYFFIKKRRSFFKSQRKDYSFYSDNIQNKFFLNYYNKRFINKFIYVKAFIELYYNK